MATHAGADSDMSIVYFSLTIHNRKKIIKTIAEMIKSQLKKGYVLVNMVVGQMTVEEDMPVAVQIIDRSLYA